jgi:hypothetical protein
MKKLLLSLTFIAVTLIAGSQSNDNFRAMIPGYKTNDTIKIADFLKLTEITLNNKEYSIVKFTLLFSDGVSDYEEISNSNKITDKMKSILSKIQLHDSKPRHIVIKDISAQSNQNKNLKLENLVYIIK